RGENGGQLSAAHAAHARKPTNSAVSVRTPRFIPPALSAASCGRTATPVRPSQLATRSRIAPSAAPREPCALVRCARGRAAWVEDRAKSSALSEPSAEVLSPKTPLRRAAPPDRGRPADLVGEVA